MTREEPYFGWEEVYLRVCGQTGMHVPQMTELMDCFISRPIFLAWW